MSNDIDEKNKESNETQGGENLQKDSSQTAPPPKESSSKKSAPKTVVEESNINLIPTMTDEEIRAEDTKSKVKLSSLISLMALFAISILVVGFNIISRIQLNAQRESLAEQERTIQNYSHLISGNTEILERVYLYEDIQEDRYSVSMVVEYLENVTSRSGSSVINDMVFSTTESFEFSGESNGLEDVAKLWYLLTNDEKILNVELRSFSGRGQTARFSFRGRLDLDEFPSL